MKRLKFLPSVLMLAMCIAVLCVGIYAASPTSNTVKGSITVTSMARIKITGYVNDEELFATRNTAAGIEWDLTKSDALKFDALNATTADEVPQKVIRIHIQNLNKDMALGAYFFNGDENTLEEIDEDTKLATYASLVHEQGIWDVNMAETDRTDDNMLASSVLSTYTYIAPANTDNDYDEIDMYITINVEHLSFEDVVGEFIYNLRVEEYRSNVTTETETASQSETIDIMTQSEGESSTKTLLKFADATNDNSAEITTSEYSDATRGLVSTTSSYFVVPSVANNTAIGGVVIPTTYTGLKAKTFDGCTSLEHIILPASIVAFEESALGNCPALRSISSPVWALDYSFYEDLDGICQKVDTHRLALFMPSINSDQYYACRYDTKGSETDGIFSFGTAYYYTPKSLKTIYINTESAEMDAFRDYGDQGSLTNVIFGPKVSVINGAVNGFFSTPFVGAQSFMLQGWYGLKTIALSKNISTLGNYAFQNCKELTNIIIPNRVTSIGNSAFSGCTGLTSITIPSSVTSIGSYAFSDCNKLTSVTYSTSGGTETTGTYTYKDGVLTINSMPSSVGKSPSWDSANINPLVLSVVWACEPTYVSNQSFSKCYNLTSVQIPSSVTSIGTSAFSYCTGLTSITIPSGVTSIGTSAFNYCTSLTSITISSGVTSIGSSAFNYCTSLTNVKYSTSGGTETTGTYTFKDGVLTINSMPSSSSTSPAWYNAHINQLVLSVEWACEPTDVNKYSFDGCYNLTSVTIPSSVTSIGTSAFYNCKGLTTVSIDSSYAYTNATSMTTCGYLLRYPTTVKVLASIVDDAANTNAYLNNSANFTKSATAVDGYYVFTKVA